jgi:hypothetical protein
MRGEALGASNNGFSVRGGVRLDLQFATELGAGASGDEAATVFG